VEALRGLGVDVHTFSIHRSDPAHLLAEADRREYERTYALRPISLKTLLSAHLTGLSQRPLSYILSLLRSLARSRGAPRDLLWQLFYFAEAVPLWLRVRAAGMRHVHSHFTHPASDVAMIVAELGDRDGRFSFSFSAHGADMQETDQPRLAEKVRRATRVVCVSDFGRSQLMSLVEPEHWPKIEVVHCGLEPAEFSMAPHDTSGAEPVSVLAVGRLIPIKGHKILLEAAALARRRGLDLRLTIVGDGPLRGYLERAAGRLGIAASVDFPGFVGQDDIGGYYARADVFCLPSLREGVPVVLMEAMASGLPVIASGIMGIPELVEHERAGLLVAPGRADAIADAIARLARDPDSRRRLGEAGRAKIEAEYELHSCTRLMASVLERAGGA
jgi:colanic acid/amylovoran biosynthesis glycosyltransferase